MILDRSRYHLMGSGWHIWPQGMANPGCGYGHGIDKRATIDPNRRRGRLSLLVAR